MKCPNSDKLMDEIIATHGAKRAIALFLMSLGNAIKHLSENVDEEEFNKIMKDPVIGLSAGYALRLMDEGHKDLKNNGVR